MTDDDRISYLIGDEPAGDLDPEERAGLDDLLDVLADPALWAEPSPGLEDRIVAAISFPPAPGRRLSGIGRSAPCRPGQRQRRRRPRRARSARAAPPPPPPLARRFPASPHPTFRLPPAGAAGLWSGLSGWPRP